MGHGDLMSQAEDVADQVSLSPRDTHTLNRPQTGLRRRSISATFELKPKENSCKSCRGRLLCAV